VADVTAGEQNAFMPGGTILVVDDDADVRETLAETLAFEGYTTEQAANGQEALDYLRNNPAPCLVLLDLMMPVMNGYDFLNAIRSEPALSSVSVFIVSAAAREQVEAAAKSSAAVGVLTKPVQLAALLGAVEKFC
jgi:CheY-like chemotaxis protein